MAETEPATLAPSACKAALASLRDRVVRVPVSTKVLPAKGCSAAAFFSMAGQWMPAASRASSTSMLCGWRRK
ncbi:hypothetical protein D3C79_960600 [compost metagenome]